MRRHGHAKGVRALGARLIPMLYVFGDFELDTSSRELRRQGQRLAVQPRVFDTLRYLVEHRDRVVSRDELVNALWGGLALNEVAVPWSISHARKALRQTARDSAPIRTLRGQGYRFTASVRQVALSDLQSPKHPRTDGEVPSWLGREPIVGALTDALQRLASGVGGRIVVAGEVGVGKTHCLQNLAKDARLLGIRTLTGSAMRGDERAPFWPWRQLLRAAAYERAHTASGERSDVREVLEIFEQRPSSTEAMIPLSGRAHVEVVERVAATLRGLAHDAPTLLICDDFDEADVESIRVWQRLSPAAESESLLVIVGARRPDKLRLPRHMGKDARVLEVGSLTQSETIQWVRMAVDPAVATEVASLIHEKTGGNALFVEETCQALLTRTQRARLPTPDDVPLAATLGTLLKSRLEILQEDSRRLVQLAALIDDAPGMGLLSAASSLMGERLYAAVDEAVEAGCLRWVDSGNSVEFSHGALREVIIGEMPRAARSALHALIATSLDSHPALKPRDAELAHHMFHALPAVDPKRVAAVCRAAADVELARCSYAAAHLYYERAITSLAHADDASPREVCELVLASSFALRRDGEVVAAKETMRRAHALALEHGFADLLVEYASQRRPTVWMASIPDESALAALTKATQLCAHDDPATLARAEAQLACTPPISWNMRASLDMSRGALSMARQAGSARAELEAMRASFHALSGPDEVSRLLIAADEVERLDSPRSSWWTSEAFFARYVAFTHQGAHFDGQHALESFCTLAARLRMPEAIWHGQRIHAQQALERGEYTLAEAQLNALFADAPQIALHHRTFFFAMQQNALHEARTGTSMLGVLIAQSELTWAWARQIAVFRAERARVWAQMGRLAEASQELESLAERRFDVVPRDLTYLYTLARLGECAVALKHAQHAETLYGLLQPYKHFNALNGCMLSLGSVSLYLGELANALGRAEEAKEHFEVALEQNRSSCHHTGTQRAARWLEETAS